MEKMNCGYREMTIPILKRKSQQLRENSRKLEKLVEFLEHWEEINGKIDPEIEQILHEMSHKINTL